MLSCLFMTSGTTAEAAKPAGSARALSADHSIPQTWIRCVGSKPSPEVQRNHIHHMGSERPQVVTLCGVSKDPTDV